MHVILTGATGLVGTGVLNHIIKYSMPAGAITRLSILSRSPVPLASKPGTSNINVITHTDYNSYPPALLDQLQGAEACIWAQGISQTAVNKEDYQKITYDYPLAAAKAFAGLNATTDKKLVFVYVSGEGATQSPGLLTMRFGKVKGEAESALIALQKDYPSLRVYNVRPGGVDPSKDPDTKDAYKGADYNARGKELLLSAMNTLASSQMTPTKDLGRLLTGLAISDGEPLSGAGVEGEGRIIRNSGLKRIVREGGVP